MENTGERERRRERQEREAAERQKRKDNANRATREAWSNAGTETRTKLTMSDTAARHPMTGDIDGINAAGITDYDNKLRRRREKGRDSLVYVKSKEGNSGIRIDRASRYGPAGGEDDDDDDGDGDDDGRSSHAAPRSTAGSLPLRREYVESLNQDPRAPSQPPSVRSSHPPQSSTLPDRSRYHSPSRGSQASVAGTNRSSRHRRDVSPASASTVRGGYTPSTLSGGVPLSHGGAPTHYAPSRQSGTRSVDPSEHREPPDVNQYFLRQESPTRPVWGRPPSPPHNTTESPSEASFGTEPRTHKGGKKKRH